MVNWVGDGNVRGDGWGQHYMTATLVGGTIDNVLDPRAIGVFSVVTTRPPRDGFRNTRNPHPQLEGAGLDRVE